MIACYQLLTMPMAAKVTMPLRYGVILALNLLLCFVKKRTPPMATDGLQLARPLVTARYTPISSPQEGLMILRLLVLALFSTGALGVPVTTIPSQ